MQTIQIGRNIAKLRREKGVTQEELAGYLGVSKPAVSKWESGQSFPDILLLPALASFFNKSVDSLLGYEAQMRPEDIKRLYRSLTDAFASEPFDTVYARCEEAVKTYYSCFGLLFAMAELLVNHAPLSGDAARTAALYEEASALFGRVESESGDAVLARQALSMRACCAIALGRPAEAIDLLGGIEELPISTDQLLAQAYAMKGESGRALDVMQKMMYTNLLNLFGAFPTLMGLYSGEPEKLDACLAKALALGGAFDLPQMQPTLYCTLYLAAAALYAGQGNREKALDLLEAYAELIARGGLFPLRLKGSAFFDRLEPYFATLNLGTDAPRSDSLVKRDMLAAVTGNPAFAPLAEEERYRRVVRRLERWETA